MPKLTQEDLERMRSVGHLSHGRTRDRVVEGRSHPETGVAFKATTDELGNTITQHNTKDDRQDVLIRPETVHAFSNTTMDGE